MGGKRQANILSAIISNFDIVEDVIETSLNSQNSAIKENEKYLDSIQGRLDKFNNATQTMWSNFIGTDLIKGFVDAGTKLIETLNQIGGTASAVAIAIGSLTSSIISMSVAKAASTEGLTLIASLKKNFTDFFKDTKAGFIKLWQFIKSPAGGIAIAATAIALIFDAIHTTAQEAADKAHEAFTEISSALGETKTIVESMTSELEGLNEQIDALDGKKLSFAEEEELKRLKQQRAELEQSLKTQQQIQDLQQQATNKSAIAAMKAYTKASSAGAEKTQETAKNVGSILGALSGVGVALGVLLAPVTGGTSLAVSAGLSSTAIAGYAAATGIGFGLLGNKLGEATGSKRSKNDGTYDSWYSTYVKAIETARAEEQKALEEYEKDTSNIDKLDKWQEAQKKTADIETEMYNHLGQMQSYYNGLEYGQSKQIDQELDTWYNFLDKLSIDQNASGAKANAIDRLFGVNASADIQEFKENMQAAAESGQDAIFTIQDAIRLGIDDDLAYLGISVEDVTSHFTQLGEEASKAINKIDFSDAIASLAKIEDVFGSLSSAMEEFMKDGSASAKTLEEMKETFGKLDSWDYYVETMLSGTATRQEAERAGEAIAQEFLDSVSGIITKDNKLGFVEALEKVGVGNASEVVDSYINNNFFDSDMLDKYSKGIRQLTGIEKVKATKDFISAVEEEYGVVLDLNDAYELLSQSDKIRTSRAKKYAEERKHAEEVETRNKQKQAKRDEILSKSQNVLLNYNNILDVINKTGEYEDATKEELDSAYETLKNHLTILLKNMGYEFSDLFPEFEIVGENIDLTFTDADIAQMEKRLADTIGSLKLDVPVDIDFDVQDHIEDMAAIEDATKSLGDVYDELHDNKHVSASTLAGLKDTFDIPGTTAEYAKFISVLSTAKSVTPEVKNAFNDLLGAWLDSSGAIDKVTEETKEQTVAMLEQFGVINALEVTEQAITQNKLTNNLELLRSKEYLSKATQDNIDDLQDEAEAIAVQCGMAEELAEDLAMLQWYREHYIKYDISSITLEDAEALYNAAQAAGVYGKNLQSLAKLKENIATIEHAQYMQDVLRANQDQFTPGDGYNSIEEVYDTYNAQIEAAMAENQAIIDQLNAPLNLDFDPIKIDIDLGDLGANDITELDWLDHYFTALENKIKDKEAELENVAFNTDNINDKNTIIDDIIGLYGYKQTDIDDAIGRYSQRAQDLFDSFDKDVQTKITDGSLDITQYNGNLAEDIQEYFDYISKKSDLEVELKNIKITIADLSKQKFENIVSVWDNKIENTFQNKQDALESHISLIEEQGIRVSTKLYQELIDVQNQEQEALKSKLKILKQTLSAEVAAGNIDVNSSQWHEMVDAIDEVNAAIIEGQTEIEQWNNAINEIKWDNFDKLISQFDAVEAEIESLYGLLSDDDKVVDDLGNWTDEGITSLGLLTQKMELAQYNAKQYEQAIIDLESDYKNGLYSQDEYNAKLAELSQKQWDSVEAYEAAKDEIIALNKVRVEAAKKAMKEEIDAYKELIDLKKESLDEDKEAREFADNVSEKEKKIANIRRQLAAIENNTSAEAAAKRKQLQAELREAQADLDDLYYDHSVKVQKDALDNEAEAFEKNKQSEMDAMDEWLEDTERVITETTKLVQDNAEVVFSTLKETASTYGVEISDIISDAIVSPWEEGVNAITKYSDAFGALADSFTGKLDGIKEAEQEIIDDADQTASGVISSVTADYAGVVSGKTIADYSEEYFDARKNLDYEGMAAANAGANAIRIENGESPQVAYQDIPYIKGLANELEECKQNWANAVADYEAGRITAGQAYEIMSEANGRANEIRTEVGAPLQDASVALAEMKQKADGYAKGTTGVKQSGLAVIDEMGLEEIVMHAGPDGRLQYLSKGSAVIPHDISENLMRLGQLDPSQVLEQSMVTLGAPNITTNNMEINLQIGEVVHIDHADNGSIPDIARAVQTQMDRYMQNINNSLKKKVR